MNVFVYFAQQRSLQMTMKCWSNENKCFYDLLYLNIFIFNPVKLCWDLHGKNTSE